MVGADVRIVDEDGNDLSIGEVGELWVRSPNNVRGYWNKPEETAKAFINGWFRSGDAARIDEDGFVYVVDRIKDMVLRGGENVYCAEVEAVLFEHDSVEDVAVIGIPHASLGEEVAAVIVPKAGYGESDTASVQEFAARRLATFKVPVKLFWQTDPLPRNATGKVLKKELRDTYSNM
jgi:long-chain acyl-CoA synthetase